MGYPTYPFVTPLNNPFHNLSNSPQIILETTSNSLSVSSISITNLTDSDIRINLKKQTNIVTPTVSTVETLEAYNILIPSYRTADSTKNYFNTMNLVQKIGLEIFLEYSTAKNEKLLCYSNGKEQLFDCSVNYIVFNEIPPS